MKYGITSSVFVKYILRSDEPYAPYDTLPSNKGIIRIQLLRIRIKQFFLLGKNFMVRKLWE